MIFISTKYKEKQLLDKRQEKERTGNSDVAWGVGVLPKTKLIGEKSRTPKHTLSFFSSTFAPLTFPLFSLLRKTSA